LLGLEERDLEREGVSQSILRYDSLVNCPVIRVVSLEKTRHQAHAGNIVVAQGTVACFPNKWGRDLLADHGVED